GGPLYPMIERLEHLGNLEGMPATIQNCDPARFFEELDATSRDLNRWKGELYLEFHRGTYTSHGLVKKYNRKCEILLREVEFLSTLALANPHNQVPGFVYPSAELERIWKLVLLNQFHDVLPGSSLKLVYDDVIRFYEDVTLTGEKLKEKALQALMGHFSSANKTSRQAVAIINTTSWPIDATLVEVDLTQPSAGVKLHGGFTWQQLSNRGRALVYVDNLGAGSIQTFAFGNKPSNFVPVKVQQIILPSSQTNADDFVNVDEDTGFEVENNFIIAKFDKHGRLVSLLEKSTKHETIAPDHLGNVFKLFEDIPIYFDAWDIEAYHLEKGWDADLGLVTIEEAGPLRVVLFVKHPLTELSWLEQRIIITAADGLIEFENKVDWRENRICLVCSW
ncbi:Alpha-mannosidase 2C1, partial [Rhizoclosmatium hyalinum]